MVFGGRWRITVMATEIYWYNGVTIKTGNDVVFFDPFKRSKTNIHFFISHAHSDHLGGLGSKGKGFLTTGTMDILSFKGKREFNNFSSLKYGERVKAGDLEILVHNAGHMLGSAQYEIRSSESTIVYTGDINYRNMLTTNAAETTSCDILILESTYGNPSYIFPSLMETSTRIVNWTIETINRKKMPIFNAYSAGKAQEVIKILNAFTNIPVVTHPSVTKVNEAYIKNGVKLTYIDSMTEEGKQLLQKGQCAFIKPSYGNMSFFKDYSLAAVTGWAVKFMMNWADAAFPLSSHADFIQLVEYVKAVKPKEVFTLYGFKEIFAHYLSRKLGVRARPIVSVVQKPLKEFL